MATKTLGRNNSVYDALGVARILIGFIFLWAFFDKLFGWGFATPEAKSWLNGGSPTTGFLSHAGGPLAGMFHSMSGMILVDWLFMLGLLGIGLALMLGIAVRIAVVTGCILLLLMWLASFPLVTNPIIDEHIVYIVVLLAVGLSLKNQRLSLSTRWRKLTFVKSRAWLW